MLSTFPFFTSVLNLKFRIFSIQKYRKCFKSRSFFWYRLISLSPRKLNSLLGKVFKNNAFISGSSRWGWLPGPVSKFAFSHTGSGQHTPPPLWCPVCKCYKLSIAMPLHTGWHFYMIHSRPKFASDRLSEFGWLEK